MQLLTDDIRAKIPGLGATEEIALRDKVVQVKFFDPCGSWTWYAVEGQEEDGDFVFFGLVDGFELEWGEFSLRELESVRGPLGLGIERDLYFGNPTIGEVLSLAGRV